MKYASVNQYYLDMPSDAVEHFAKVQARELLDTVLGEMKKNVWYAIRMREDDFQIHEEMRIRKTMTVEIKPVREEKTVIRTAEELILTPSQSFKTKLKNCIKYLRDNTGGRIDIEEISHECID